MPSGEDSHFQFLAENSVDIIVRSGFDRIIRYVSPSCFHLLGWTPEEMVGKGPQEFVPAEDMPAIDAAAAKVLTADDSTAAAVARMRKKDGSYLWMEFNGRLVFDDATGEPSEYVLVLRDITERKQLEERLTAMAMTDGLTGVANRRAFDRALLREWKRTLRDGSQISLLLLDIDHFKQFNDLNGHQAGDDCLRAVVAAITGSVRGSDVVARYGGEEIAVILPTTDTADAVRVADKVRTAVERLQLPNPGSPDEGKWVTVSVGVATAMARVGGSIKMPESLLLAADMALYKAKHEGRNRVATSLLVASKRG